MNTIQETRKEVIQVQDLWAKYDDEIILENINLTIYEKDFIGLIGPNGGGKTTLIKIILGLLPALKGQVKILGKPIHEGRAHLGYVPQSMEFDRAFPIKVWDVVQMGRLHKRKLFRSYAREDDHIVEENLRTVGMLDYKDRAVGELSGGQKQRIFIARALSTKPDILILDEPTASIDAQTSASIFDLLNELNETITIMMVSHDIGAISSHVKTIGCLNHTLFYHGEKAITP
ncbi:MAG: ABC transporter ATP-binding protein, partial [Anaerolineaceae bacterium]|nr:ABC transporter ATP-binding protein [Anaerolineaceae bacterium]